MQAVQKFGIPRREARTVETATINYVYGCSVRPVEVNFALWESVFNERGINGMKSRPAGCN